MRQRQHLAALHVVDRALVLTTLRFNDDLVAMPAVATGKLAAKEIALAAQLVDGMSDRWDPARYTDDYVPALMKLIDAKARGKRCPILSSGCARASRSLRNARRPRRQAGRGGRGRRGLDETWPAHAGPPGPPRGSAAPPDPAASERSRSGGAQWHGPCFDSALL